MKRESIVRAFAVIIIMGLFSPVFSAEAAIDAGWSVAQPIENNDSDASDPQLSTDGQGNAIAVWEQGYDIWSNRYVVGVGWETAQPVSTDDSDYASLPQISVDRLGNAIAVWTGGDGFKSDIWSSRYVVGTGWESAQLVETNDSETAHSTGLAGDSSGNAIAVWVQGGHIWSNRFNASVGWESAQLVETNDSEYASTPQISVDSLGNAIAVWVQYDGVRCNIWASRYATGIGWSSAESIESDDSGDALFPEVAMDVDGNSIAVWFQYDGFRNCIYSNRYTVGAGWGVAELVEPFELGDTDNPSVNLDFDDGGNAIAVWRQHSESVDSIWANRYVPGIGWGEAELVETNNLGQAYVPQVSVDGSGNATAVWQQKPDGSGYSNIYSSRYVVGTGWGTAQLVDTQPGAYSPQISVDETGNAVVLWVLYEGGHKSIWSSRYSISEIVPNDSGEVEVGIRAGDWVRLEYSISNAPYGTSLPLWIKVEFLSIDETTATVRITMHMTDGSEEEATAPISVVSGGEVLGLSGFVIPVDTCPGDMVCVSGYEDVWITGETTRKYAGASRTVVYATVYGFGFEGDYYWDKQTGVLVEVNGVSSGISVTAVATETNMWDAQSTEFLSNPTVLFAMAIAAVAVVVAIAFIVKRKRKAPPEDESPQS